MTQWGCCQWLSFTTVQQYQLSHSNMTIQSSSEPCSLCWNHWKLKAAQWGWWPAHPCQLPQSLLLRLADPDLKMKGCLMQTWKFSLHQTDTSSASSWRWRWRWAASYTQSQCDSGARRQCGYCWAWLAGLCLISRLPSVLTRLQEMDCSPRWWQWWILISRERALYNML